MSDLPLGHGLPHLGLMHLVATNLTIWLRTVIKETLHEMESHHLTATDHNSSTLGHCRQVDLPVVDLLLDLLLDLLVA